MSEEQLSMSDALNGVEPVTEQPPAEDVKEPETEAQGEQPEATEPEASPSEAKPQIDPEQFKGYLDEREKRQRLEREIEALKANQKPEEKPDPVSDPEGFQANLERQRQEDRFELSRMTMVAVKEDYEQMEQLFLQEAQKSPFLQDQLRNAANPALLAYQEGQRIAQRNAAPEVNAEMQTELEALRAEVAALKGSSAPNLAKTGQSGIQTQPEETPLRVSDLLDDLGPRK